MAEVTECEDHFEDGGGIWNGFGNGNCHVYEQMYLLLV
jgi:hypothetical protein